MRIRLALYALLGLGLGVGCSPTVGDACDEEAARTPYYEMGTGTPMYPGQAMIAESCASCHGESTSMGAPEGLNFPLDLVTGSGAEAVSGGRRLLWAQSNVHRHRDLVYGSVVGGSMPPRGSVPASTRFADADGNELPLIRSEEGQEMLRNWLACGSPVVERTTPLVQPCSEDAACEVTNFCDLMEGNCVGVGDVVPAGGGGTVDCEVPESTWSWVYTCLFSGTTCTNAGCHGSTAPAGGLALPDVASAHAALVDQAPGDMSPSCMGAGAYVIPGDADGSLLIHKLEGVDASGTAVCGSRMPVGPLLSQEEIDIVREWIDAGAMND